MLRQNPDSLPEVGVIDISAPVPEIGRDHPNAGKRPLPMSLASQDRSLVGTRGDSEAHRRGADLPNFSKEPIADVRYLTCIGALRVGFRTESREPRFAADLDKLLERVHLRVQPSQLFRRNFVVLGIPCIHIGAAQKLEASTG